jgi:hypothetical protein
MPVRDRPAPGSIRYDRAELKSSTTERSATVEPGGPIVPRRGPGYCQNTREMQEKIAIAPASFAEVRLIQAFLPLHVQNPHIFQAFC